MALTRQLTRSLTRSLTRKLTGEELNRLFLEKFKLTLGSELITNGTFDADSNWTKGTGWTIGSGVATHASGTSSGLDQAFTFQSGKTYDITFDVVACSGGSGSVQARGNGSTAAQTIDASTIGANTFRYTDTTNHNTLRFDAGSGTTLTVDNVSVKEITKQAPVAAFSLRKLGDVSPYACRIRRSSDNTEAQVMFDASDRVSESSVVRNTSQNLLPSSEDFGEWSLGNSATVSRASSLTDPFGGNNAWELKGSSSVSYSSVSKDVAQLTTGKNYTSSCYMKAGTSTLTRFTLYDSNTSPNHLNLDINWSASGVPTKNAGTSASVNNEKFELISDGWYRISFNSSALNADGTQSIQIHPDRNTTSKTVYAFGAMLEETVTYESTPSIPYSEDFNDDTGGWTDSDGGGSSASLSHETANPLSGSGSLKITMSNTGTSIGYPRIRKSTGADFKTGIKYRFSFKAKLLSGSPECDIRFGTGSFNMRFATNQTFTTTEQTYTYTDIFDTLPTSGINFIDLLFDGTKGPFELLIDDVKVEEFDPIPSEYISTPVVSNDGLTFTETTLDTFVGGENLVPYSEDFSNAAYFEDDITVASSNVTDPFGGTGAYKLTKTGSNGHMADLSIATTGQVKSIYARTVSGTGTVDLLGHKDIARYSVTVTEEWQRFDFVVDTSELGGNHFYTVDFRGTDATLTEVLLFGAQLNTNSLKTYQKTTGTARDGNASIVTLYNQTGGEDAIQATSGAQPLLYNAGLLVRSGTSAAIEYPNVNPQKNLTFQGIAGILLLESFYVVEANDTTYTYPTGQSGGQYGFIATDGASGDTNKFNSYGSPTLEVNGVVVSQANRDEIHDSLNGRKLVYHRGGDVNSWTEVKLGQYSTNTDSTFSLSGHKFSEIIFFDSDQHANQAAIEADINDFHNIF